MTFHYGMCAVAQSAERVVLKRGHTQEKDPTG